MAMRMLLRVSEPVSRQIASDLPRVKEQAVEADRRDREQERGRSVRAVSSGLPTLGRHRR